MQVSDLDIKIILRPNNSLSPTGSVKVLAVLFLILLIVATSFSLMGAWLVLPFAGLEILGLAGAFYYVYLHSNDYESITITDENLIVEKKNYKELTTTTFQRYWAQVIVRDLEQRHASGRKIGLFITSHGKEVEFGRYFINDGQRTMFARELREKLRNIY